MDILSIIDKKRNGLELSYEELEYAFNSYLKEKIKNYQMSALLMAICINGMTDEEVFNLTDIFIKSGETLDLSSVDGIKVDKHSTGGVGDKTSLIVAPIVASLGIKVPKMSGRGLGITGGTIDKLESIPGFYVDLTKEEFLNELNDIGMVICSQTEQLVPLDKVIYSLRDVTATVSSIPLIAVSIMSKKIASGADKIFIDIKVGSGALLKTEHDAKLLKDLVIRIGDRYNREVRCIISDMNTPLGMCVGNALEVAEAELVLEGAVKNNLYDLSVEIASNMVSMGKGISIIEARELVEEAIRSEAALDTFMSFIEYQHGRLADLEISDNTIEVVAEKAGTITKIDAYLIGEVSCKLGAGKLNLDDKIDTTVGVRLEKKIGDKVEVGDVLCTLFVNKVNKTFNIVNAFIIE